MTLRNNMITTAHKQRPSEVLHSLIAEPPALFFPQKMKAPVLNLFPQKNKPKILQQKSPVQKAFRLKH